MWHALRQKRQRTAVITDQFRTSWVSLLYISNSRPWINKYYISQSLLQFTCAIFWWDCPIDLFQEALLASHSPYYTFWQWNSSLSAILNPEHSSLGIKKCDFPFNASTLWNNLTARWCWDIIQTLLKNRHKQENKGHISTLHKQHFQNRDYSWLSF